MQMACHFLFPKAIINPIFHAQLLEPALRPWVINHLDTSDLVFTLPWSSEYGEFAGDGIRSHGAKVVVIPEFVFGGFHPDLTYAKAEDGSSIRSPMIDYNSRIAIAAFSAGLDVSRTIGLFNSLVYRRLGYFDAFDVAITDAKSKFEDAGYDIAPLFAGWMKRGCFMHSSNHPKSFVTTDIMKMVCRQEGLGTNLNAPLDSFYPDDVASGAVYALYPELARPLGLQGSYHFKPPTGSSGNRLLDLRAFVEGSFRMYEGADVSTWQLSEPTQRVVDLIAQMA